MAWLSRLTQILALKVMAKAVFNIMTSSLPDFTLQTSWLQNTTFHCSIILFMLYTMSAK